MYIFQTNKKKKCKLFSPPKTQRKSNHRASGMKRKHIVNMRKHTVNMINLNLNISVVTFNVNGLNVLVRSQKTVGMDEKTKPKSYH